MDQKTLMCFGDSLTWGFLPGGHRLPFHRRWTGVLQNALGPAARIIEEALNGRTTVFDDIYAPFRSGKDLLPILVECHSPLDLLIIMLGTNDLQPYRRLTPAEVARGCAVLVDLARLAPRPSGTNPPEILLVAPPALKETSGLMAFVFDGAEQASELLPRAIEEVAEDRKCHFFAADAVPITLADGIHLDEPSHQRLGSALAPLVRKILGLADE